MVGQPVDALSVRGNNDFFFHKLTRHPCLLPLAKMAPILAFYFVIGAVVDKFAFSVPFNVVGGAVRDGCYPQAVGMPFVPTKEQVLRSPTVVAAEVGQS